MMTKLRMAYGILWNWCSRRRTNKLQIVRFQLNYWSMSRAWIEMNTRIISKLLLRCLPYRMLTLRKRWKVWADRIFAWISIFFVYCSTFSIWYDYWNFERFDSRENRPVEESKQFFRSQSHHKRHTNSRSSKVFARKFSVIQRSRKQGRSKEGWLHSLKIWLLHMNLSK